MSEERIAPANARQQRPKREKRDVHGWCILDKPVGMTSTHAVSVVKRLYPREARRPCRHARSAGVGPAADRARRGDQDRPVRDGRPQDLPLHRALGRGARHRRQRGPRHRQQRRPADARRRSARCCPASPARSSRSRRATPRSRSTANAPTTSRAKARSWNLRARPVDIHRLDLVETPDADHTVLAAECGKGTYVRAIARDMGRALGCYGHVSALRRTGVGPFQEADARRASPALQAAAPRRRRRRLAALTALLQPVDAGLQSIPSLERQPRRRRAPRARPGRAAARPRRPDHAGLRRGLDPWRPDRAGRVRAGRVAAAAHLQSRQLPANRCRRKFFLFFQCLTRCGAIRP